MSIAKKSEAYREVRTLCKMEGLLARRAGKAASDNPFPIGSMRSNAWAFGWSSEG